MSTDTSKASTIFLRIPGEDNLFFRPLEEKDVPFMTTMINDVRLRPYFLRAFPCQEKEEKEWILGMAKDKPQHLVLMITNEAGLCFGTMGLHDIDQRHRTAFTGAMLAQGHHNRGIGYRAKMVLLAHAFFALDLEEIGSRVAGFNQRSVAYSEKCGYREVGRLTNWIRWNHRSYDEVVLQLSFADWLPLFEAFKKQYNYTVFDSFV